MPRMMGAFSLLLLLFTLSTTTESIAFQDNPWARNVRRQLRAHASTMADYDIVASHDVFVDTLKKGYYKDVNYRLEAGVRYIFVGACDQDCTDLDMKLFDDNWQLIASDTQPDAEPVIIITTRRTTTFHLRVIMEACTANPCWWGVGAYKPASD
jgi:hypothetical protein